MARSNGSDEVEHDPYAALRVREFRFFITGNFLAVLGMQMQTAAVGWEIYERTESNFALGLVGLVQFVPVLSLALVTGHVADRADRRRIITAALGVIALSSLGLAWISATQADVGLMYLCLFSSSVARAFGQPARASFLPQIVPRDRFSNAVTWNTGGFHLASVLGPAGLLIVLPDGVRLVYLFDAIAALSFIVLLGFVRSRPVIPANAQTSLRDLLSGLLFVWRNQIVLGAITLDMFAVLLGGCITLLPVYAKDMLDVGSAGFSYMRAAPAVGACAMSLLLAHRPPMQQAGKALLWSVAGFGLATIVFGLSRSFWLSLAMLFLTGALDNISVVIRHTLVQLLTPDEQRGRVSAVNGLFIGASNELGGFESGAVAHLFGPVVSVVSGGIGTILVVLTAALIWPDLRQYGRIGSGTSGKELQVE